jgi:CheY-like chemotaxis protein
MQRSAHTICVVDDHEASRYAAAKSLQALGYKTVEAETGEDAIMAADGAVSALLLDVNLPDMNGVKVCQVIKSKLRRQLPVVLMTAVYVDDLHRSAGMSAGADAYLTSPISRQQLGAVFDKLLGVDSVTP